MAIGVEGSFYLLASIGNKRDFIEEPDLKEFTIIEKAGNELPVFHLEFDSGEEDLIPLLNDGQSINIQFGRTKDDVMDIKLSPVTVVTNRKGDSEYSHIVTGMAYHLGYISDSKATITDSKSGVEVIKDYASSYGFKFEGNIDKSRDSQNWCQYGITPIQFISDVWLHSYLNNSFIGMGITSDSRMIVKDIKKEIQAKNEKPDWRFVKGVKSEAINEIPFSNNYSIVNNSGLVNSWLANGRERLVYNLPKASQGKISVKPEPIMALSNQVILNSQMGRKFSGSSINTGSTHDKYWEAFQTNLTNLASLSSLKITIPCGQEFKPIKVLDVVMFKDNSALNSLESNEYLSGLYLVARVIRTVKDRSLSTYIDICRESPNAVINAN